MATTAAQKFRVATLGARLYAAAEALDNDRPSPSPRARMVAPE